MYRALEDFHTWWEDQLIEWHLSMKGQWAERQPCLTNHARNQLLEVQEELVLFSHWFVRMLLSSWCFTSCLFRPDHECKHQDQRPSRAQICTQQSQVCMPLLHCSPLHHAFLHVDCVELNKDGSNTKLGYPKLTPQDLWSLAKIGSNKASVSKANASILAASYPNHVSWRALGQNKIIARVGYNIILLLCALMLYCMPLLHDSPLHHACLVSSACWLRVCVYVGVSGFVELSTDSDRQQPS